MRLNFSAALSRVPILRGLLSGPDSVALAPGQKGRINYQLKRQYQFRAALQMDNWRKAVDAAEHPTQPDRRPLLAIYREIMDDCHLSSQIQTAKFSVLEQPFMIVDATTKKPDLERTELLMRPWFDDFVEMVLDAQYWGFSLIEFTPLGESKSPLVPQEMQSVVQIPREHVWPEAGCVLPDPSNRRVKIDYTQAPFTDWLFFVGDPSDLGLLKKASREVIWKVYSRTDWSRRGEKYGQPMIILKTDTTADAELDKKEHMLANIGSNGYAILSSNDEFTLIESAKSDGYKIFKEKADFCDAQMSKLVVGQTMTSDDGSSLSQSEVHERILDRYVTADLRWVQKLVNFRLIPFLIRHGYPLEGYRFAYQSLQPKPKAEKPAGKPDKPDDPAKDDTSTQDAETENFTPPILLANKVGAGCCGPAAATWQLAAGPQASLNAEIERVAKLLHDNPSQVPKGQMSLGIYQAVAKELWGGVKEGWNKPTGGITYNQPDTQLLERVRRNVFAFSGAKNLSQMQALRDSVYDASGQIVPWTDFRAKALAINQQYNESYLRVEHDAVVRAGTMGSKWLDIERDHDLFPYLRYRTVGDSRVRDAHRVLEGVTLPVTSDFWNTHYPPNDWNCRCSVDQVSQAEVDKGRAKVSDDNTAGKLAKDSTPKYWRGNVGKTGVVMDLDGHPYAQALPDPKHPDANQLTAVRNYGMRKIEQIYADPSKMPQLTPRLGQPADFDGWWDDMVAKHPSAEAGAFELRDLDGLPRLFSPKFKKHLATGSNNRVTLHPVTPDLLQQPDEVWSLYQGGGRFATEFFTVYLKYYQERAVLLLVDAAGAVNSCQDIALANIGRLESFRRGVLLFRK